nr:lasso peptide biosynthesis B2 protein [uncultured Emticicia sp.]
MKVGLKIKRFIRLSIRQKVLLLTVLLISLYSYFLFRFFKHSAKFGYADKEFISHKTIDMVLVKDISFTISVVKNYTPWENVCRHQAYQAMLLCRLYQIPYQIFVGFKKSDEGKIEGHAWMIVQGEIITGFCKVEEFTIQAIYS